MAEVRIIVGARVEDLPEPVVPSRQFTCAKCAKPVWLSERSGAPFADEGQPVWCLDCMLEQEPSVDQIEPAGEAVAEMIAHVKGVYIGPIPHEQTMCKPGRCPGPLGCWCQACERGEHPRRLS